MYSLENWSKEMPTTANAGQWFFVRYPHNDIYFAEVRLDQPTGQLFLCRECHSGIAQSSYGTPLRFFPAGSLEFCGPIPMPPNYRAVPAQAPTA